MWRKNLSKKDDSNFGYCYLNGKVKAGTTIEAEKVIDQLSRTSEEEAEDEGDDEPEDEGSSKKKFNLEYLWWMIPTIILAVLIIVVVIVFFFKKIRKPSKKAAPAPTKDAIAKKHSRYDDNKE